MRARVGDRSDTGLAAHGGGPSHASHVEAGRRNQGAEAGEELVGVHVGVGGAAAPGRLEGDTDAAAGERRDGARGRRAGAGGRGRFALGCLRSRPSAGAGADKVPLEGAKNVEDPTHHRGLGGVAFARAIGGHELRAIAFDEALELGREDDVAGEAVALRGDEQARTLHGPGRQPPT